jgi:hypothetical protein
LPKREGLSLVNQTSLGFIFFAQAVEYLIFFDEVPDAPAPRHLFYCVLSAACRFAHARDPHTAIGTEPA